MFVFRSLSREIRKIHDNFELSFYVTHKYYRKFSLDKLFQQIIERLEDPFGAPLTWGPGITDPPMRALYKHVFYISVSIHCLASERKCMVVY